MRALLLSTVCLLFSCMAHSELRVMQFEQPEIQVAVANALLELDVEFVDNGAEGLLLSTDDWNTAVQLAMSIAEEVLPQGRSSSFNVVIKREVESRLRDRGIPFENRCVDGTVWTIWPHEYESEAEQVLATVTAALESGELRLNSNLEQEC